MTPYRERLDNGEYASTSNAGKTTAKKRSKSDTVAEPEPGTATPKDDE